MRRKPGVLARAISMVQIGVSIGIAASTLAAVVVNMNEARKHENETAAIAFMRSWVTAQESYYKKHNHYSHMVTDLIEEGYLSAPENSSHGYEFALTNSIDHEYAWWGVAIPVTPGITGDRSFYVDSRGILRWTRGTYPNFNSPPIDGGGVFVPSGSGGEEGGEEGGGGRGRGHSDDDDGPPGHSDDDEGGGPWEQDDEGNWGWSHWNEGAGGGGDSDDNWGDAGDGGWGN